MPPRRCPPASTHTGTHTLLDQILVDLADLQDQEVGDGTTSVVIFASELLKRGNDLVRSKIHPTSILSGFRLAMREVRACIQRPVPQAGMERRKWKEMSS